MSNTADQISESLMHSAMDSHISNTDTLLRILEEMLNRRNFTEEDLRGLSVILKHMRSGGQVNMSTVDMADMEAVCSILQGLN